MRITALLVSHNGSRWLPQVVAALETSVRSPDHVVAVDTGSDDGSPALLAEAFGPGTIGLAPRTSYAAAVRAGLASTDGADAPEDPDEWVWLLHDDCAPDPDCLSRLAAAAASAPPDLVALGPKLREWPSLRRLLEVGVTISGTGRRETGLEAGEYDQGQHDDVDPVLAVNTAGMLVRRDVLESVGLSGDLPLFGNDLDLGWRLARRGQQVRVVPDAIMFHAEAAHRGRRSGPLAERPRRDERAAAMFVLLVNGSRRTHLLRAVRLLVGGLLRALGFLLVRAPAEARDEVAALGRVYGHPGRIRRGRRLRRREATVADREVRPLLPPFWMPWRRALDALVDLGRSLVQLGRESLERRRGGGPARTLPDRLVHSPSAWSLLVILVVALVAGRGLLHGDPLHGGALLPAPDGPGHWWSAWAASWHWIGAGSAQPAPAYLLPLAILGTILLGQPALVVWLLFCLTVPLAMLGALRFLRRLTGSGWAPVWGAATYALLPVTSGAVSQGRLGTVAGVLLLPWVATAALGLADADADRRARATWRTAVLAAVLVAFVPAAYLALLVLLLLAGPLGAASLPVRQRVAIAAVPVLFCAPWLPVLLHAPTALLVEAGRAAKVPVDPDTWHLIAGTSAGPGAAPAWLTAGIALAAIVALLRVDTRPRVLRLWLVALVAGLLLAVVARVDVSLPGVSDDFRAWPGFALLLLVGALVAAATVAGDDVGRVVAGASFGWRQPVAAVAFAGALLAPVGGAVWWLAHGTEPPVHRSAERQVPAYMAELASGRHDAAALVLRGGPGVKGHPAVEYLVARGSRLVLGDDAVLAATAPDQGLDRAVTAVVGARAGGAAATIAAHGIAYVYAPPPVSNAVAGALDAADGFEAASSPRPRARAWRVVPTPSLTAVEHRPSAAHPWLLAVQVLTLVAGVVLALPGRREQG